MVTTRRRFGGEPAERDIFDEITAMQDEDAGLETITTWSKRAVRDEIKSWRDSTA